MGSSGVFGSGLWESGCRGRCIVASGGVCGCRVAVEYKQRMAMRVEDRQMEGKGGVAWVE